MKLITKVVFAVLFIALVGFLFQNSKQSSDSVSNEFITDKAETVQPTIATPANTNVMPKTNEVPLETAETTAETNTTILEKTYTNEELLEKLEEVVKDANYIKYEGIYSNASTAKQAAEYKDKFDWDEFNEFRKGKFVYPGDRNYQPLLQFLQSGDNHCIPKSSNIGLREACIKDKLGDHIVSVYQLHGYEPLYVYDVLWQYFAFKQHATGTMDFWPTWGAKYASSRAGDARANQQENSLYEHLELEKIRSGMLKKVSIQCEGGQCLIMTYGQIPESNLRSFYNMYPNCFDIRHTLDIQQPNYSSLICFDSSSTTW